MGAGATYAGAAYEGVEYEGAYEGVEIAGAGDEITDGAKEELALGAANPPRVPL